MDPLRLTLPPPGTEVKVTPEPGRAFALAFSTVGTRFERGGSNLYIDAPDGAQLVITDYFLHSELIPFYTEDGKLVAGADFLMVMNPVMDLTASGSFAAPKGGRAAYFSPLEKPLDEGVFYSLASGDVPDYGYGIEWDTPQVGVSVPGAGAALTGSDSAHYWIGRDVCQGQAFIQELEGAITVTVRTPPEGAVKAFLTYVALNGEDADVGDCCLLDDSVCGNSLFQDGPMGRASTTLNRGTDSDTLVLAAEGFYSFQAYFGGWLTMSIPSMRVQEIHILMNAPSGQSVVDLEDYFSGSVFSEVPISWSYDDGRKLSNSLAEFADDGFSLVELIDALGTEHDDLHHLGDHENAHPADDTLAPRVENVVLVRVDTNDAVKLQDEWAGEEETVSDNSYKTFTLDEQTLLIQDDDPASRKAES